MKLIKARVENFKSIEDSGEFAIDDGMTCLVGKNESGKTSLLTALYRLSPIFDGEDQFGVDADYPRRFHSDYRDRHPDDEANVVNSWWQLDDAEKKVIADELGAGALKSDEVFVRRGYDNTNYWRVSLDGAAVVSHIVKTGGLSDADKGTLVSVKEPKALKAAAAALPASPERDAFVQSLDTRLPEGSANKAAIRELELPKFMLFSQYQRMEGQVSLQEISKRKKANQVTANDHVFLALCDMAGTDVDAASKIQQFESLIAKFEGASNKITAEVFKYWSQNRSLQVQFRLDPAQPNDPAPFNAGHVFRTRIYNQLHLVTVPFDDRSTGFVWFFSFLALFSQVKKRHAGKLILLLDEPGLSLHGKAQGDLLRYFKERLLPHHQVIFTTHSPFMVPPDNLLCARTVEDVVKFKDGQVEEILGTKVGSDVLSTDKDTLFPLQGALGYEITQTLFVGEHTLLVEGPSDLLYLKALSEELRGRKRASLDQRWTICPAGGIDKVSAFMTLFGGNKLHVAVLTDFASGQKKKVDDLRRSDLLRKGHVFTADAYAGQAEADVEDLLGAAAYVELVNACYSLKGKQAVGTPAAGSRVVKHVEDHFRTLASAPEFDHFTPSAYLIENRTAFLKGATDLDAALDRFEKLFKELNALL